VPSGITRKSLKVKVANQGGAIAHQCRGEFQVISGESRHPSDIKTLCWDNENSRSIDIGINRSEFLNIVFADSNFPTMYHGIVPNIFALSSTHESLYRRIKYTLAQDAFGIGDFVIKLTVASDEGIIDTKRLTLHVDKDNTQLNIDINSQEEQQSKTRWRAFKARIWK
jgi:hypothetical protein